MKREARLTIRFASMEDAADFFREAKAKRMLPHDVGVRRANTQTDATSRGVILDQLIVDRVGASVGWVVDPREPLPASLGGER